jgi:hypothetical protein
MSQARRHLNYTPQLLHAVALRRKFQLLDSSNRWNLERLVWLEEKQYRFAKDSVKRVVEPRRCGGGKRQTTNIIHLCRYD